MKRAVINITISSVVSLAAYIALYSIWGALLSTVEDPTLKNTIVSLMTAAAYSLILLYFRKIRGDRCSDEIMEDYKDTKYTGYSDDIKVMLSREKTLLIAVNVCVILCWLLNTVDIAIFGKKTFSAVTFIFAPMCILSTAIPIRIIGYVLNGMIICVIYCALLMYYRRKRSDHWLGK